MKTAREIIAEFVRCTDLMPDDLTSRLAAEGFSIVETGRDPVMVVKGAWPAQCLHPNSCSRHKQCMYIGCPYEGISIKADIDAALSRSTREGKTG